MQLTGDEEADPGIRISYGKKLIILLDTMNTLI
jgi:hypothetical protein